MTTFAEWAAHDDHRQIPPCRICGGYDGWVCHGNCPGAQGDGRGSE